MMVYVLPGDPVIAHVRRPPPEPGHGHCHPQTAAASTSRSTCSTCTYMKSAGHRRLRQDLQRRAASSTCSRTPSRSRSASPWSPSSSKLVIGIPAGLISRPAPRQARSTPACWSSTLLVISIPIFVLGFLLQFFFGVKLGWFQAHRRRRCADQGPVAAGHGAGVAVARLRRAADPNVRGGEPARRLRAHRHGQGPAAAPGGQCRTLLRNSLIPVVTFIGTDFGALMGGAIVTEGIFNIPGVGVPALPGDRLRRGPDGRRLRHACSCSSSSSPTCSSTCSTPCSTRGSAMTEPTPHHDGDGPRRRGIGDGEHAGARCAQAQGDAASRGACGATPGTTCAATRSSWIAAALILLFLAMAIFGRSCSPARTRAPAT